MSCFGIILCRFLTVTAAAPGLFRGKLEFFSRAPFSTQFRGIPASINGWKLTLSETAMSEFVIRLTGFTAVIFVVFPPILGPNEKSCKRFLVQHLESASPSDGKSEARLKTSNDLFRERVSCS